MKKNDTKSKSTPKTHIILLVIAYITFFCYLAFEIIDITNISDSIYQILGCKKNKKNNSSVISIGSILVIIYCTLNILLLTKVINLPKDDYVPNFYNQSVLKLNEWKKGNNINVIEKYEYSDTIKKDYIISQNISAPTLTKDIKEIIITISLGPDLDKEVIVPNFIGLKYDEVLEYIEENHLSNVKIIYQKSDKPIDTVISQSKSGTLKRNTEIIITFAKDTDEFSEMEIIDFTGKTKLEAISWLEKYGFKVEIIEDYSDDIDEGLVMNQSAKNETKNPETDRITLTISKTKPSSF